MYNNGYNQAPSDKKNTRIITIALVISWLLILAGVWRVFFRQPSTPVTPSTPTEVDTDTGTTARWFIGEKVLYAGVMSQNETFVSGYSHTLSTANGREFGLKSSDLDLFLYSGNVELKGVIADFAGEMPIIQVEEIVADTSNGNSNGSGSVLEGNEDFFYSKDDNLGFDLSVVEGYEVVDEGTDIKLVDTESNETILSVSTFECITGDPLQDCAALEQKFEELNNDTFVSSQNITYYNLTETNTWIAFNDSNQGYTVRPSSSESLSNFIGFVQFLTPSSLLAFVEDNKDQCKAIGSVLQEVTEASFEETSPGLLLANINGMSANGAEVTCDMYIRLGAKLTVKQATIEQGSQPIEDDNDEVEVEVEVEVDTDDADQDVGDVEDVDAGDETGDEDSVEENAEGIAQDTVIVERPSSLEGWLSYQSVRGYTVRFSNQAISYGGQILEEQEDFGIDAVYCPYKVQITSWQQADTLDTNPDVEIFECVGQIEASQATANNLQIIGGNADKVFVAKYLTTNLDPLTLWVDIPESIDEE